MVNEQRRRVEIVQSHPPSGDDDSCSILVPVIWLYIIGNRLIVSSTYTLLRRAPMYYEDPVLRWDSGLCDTEQVKENMTGLTTFNIFQVQPLPLFELY